MLLSEPLQRSIGDIRILPEAPLESWDLGDVGEEERKAIAARGLRRPVGITGTGELVFGLGALRVCRELGWREVNTVVVDIAGIVAGAYSPEELRAAFEPDERIGVRRAILRQVLPAPILAALTGD